MLKLCTVCAEEKDGSIELICVDENNDTVSLLVQNTPNFFYIGGVNRDLALGVVRKEMQRRNDGTIQVDFVERSTIYGYKSKMSRFAKVSTRTYKQLRSLVWKLNQDGTYEIFESHIKPLERFSIVSDISGFCWIEVLRPVKSSSKRTYCKHEYFVNYEHVRRSKEQMSVPAKAMQKFNFDIEATGLDPEKSEAFMIHCHIDHPSKVDHPGAAYLLTCNPCDERDDRDVVYCKSEAEMLHKFRKLILTYQPIILTGYNIKKYDFPYLLKRAQILKVKEFGQFDWFRGQNVTYKVETRSSAQKGTYEVCTLSCSRYIHDVFNDFQFDGNLSSAKLDSVAAYYLKDEQNNQKDKFDGGYKEMIALGTSNDPKEVGRCADYCKQDVDLVGRLIDKRKLIFNAKEMCRIAGIFPSYLARGACVKTAGLLLGRCKRKSIIIPTFRKDNEGVPIIPQLLKIGFDIRAKQQGATVLDPSQGLYRDPIAILDFASLYPSIIRAFNLCWTTILFGTPREYGLKEEDCRLVDKYWFVKPKIKKGILPETVRELLEERAKTKKMMKATDDAMYKDVLDARQLSYKICANSCYGFTSAVCGNWFALPILAHCVTFCGRKMIMDTKFIIEEQWGLKTVYGDTDSVFVSFKGYTKEEANKKAYEIEEYLNDSKTSPYLPPNQIEFENLIMPMLFTNKKKKYAGVNASGKLYYKGIELKRRDNFKHMRDVQYNFLVELLKNGDQKQALEIVKDGISRLARGKVPMEDLTITKKLSKLPEDYTNRPEHVQLVAKLRERRKHDDTAPVYDVGDRVPFVVVRGKGKQSERAEDPKYVRQHRIGLDLEYYNERLVKAMERLMVVLFDDPKQLQTFFRNARGGPMSKFLKTVPVAKTEIVNKKKRKASVDRFKPTKLSKYFT